MIGGFAAIAWPVAYGKTGIKTFVMGYKGDVYEQDLGPNTAQRAASITPSTRTRVGRKPTWRRPNRRQSAVTNQKLDPLPPRAILAAEVKP